MNNVAFIPLRAGGKRVGLIEGRDKERALLGDHPLMAWTICHARDSGIFNKIIAVTRSEKHAVIAKQYGVDEVIERPAYTVRDTSPDIEWVLHALDALDKKPTLYSILRVTSPFRTSRDIKSMYGAFIVQGGPHSARMVTPVEQHPGKMWVYQHGTLLPLLPFGDEQNPWHSQPTQSLTPVYIQTAGMEIAWTKMTLETKTIAGSQIMPYVVTGLNALDINTRLDWYVAEQAVANDLVEKPESLKALE